MYSVWQKSGKVCGHAIINIHVGGVGKCDRLNYTTEYF